MYTVYFHVWKWINCDFSCMIFFYWKPLFLLSLYIFSSYVISNSTYITFITQLLLGNGSTVFVKKFYVESSSDSCFLRSPESQKVVFGNWSVQIYVYTWLYVEYLTLYVSKTNKNRSTKFYRQYQLSV